ncbi:hypothetical protein BJ742DRAFT_777549 [Cladochytrium replicatum]|nr:hypothetical protein BJ742DRAFT_777549 [Cladochytrium replicatum]
MSSDVLFLGSSLDAGTLGVNWIKALQPAFENSFRLHNYGINGLQLPGLILKLKSPTAIPATIRPVAIIVMLRKISRGRLGRPDATPDVFTEDLETVVTLLKDRFPESMVALCDIKPIGEDVDGKLNDYVRLYNEIITSVAQKHSVAMIRTFDSLAAWSKKDDAF